MPVPGTQVTLTLGVESTIPTPSGIVPSVGQSWSVEIENVSPWVLTVNVSGKPYNLAPGMGQLYASTSGPASVTVIPSGSAASGSFYVLSNWAVSPDHIPGTFPVVVAPSLTGSVTANPPLVGVLQQYNATIPGAATTTFGPFDVRQAGALGLQYQVGANGAVAHPCQWEMDWAATSGGSPVYSEIWQMDAPGALAPSAPGLLDVFAPLAGFVTLKVTPSAGAPLLNLLLWAMPLGAAFERPSPQVMIALSETIGAGATFPAWPGLGGTTAFQIPGTAVSSLRASQAPNLASFGFFTGSGYTEFAAFGKPSSASPAFDPTIAQVNIPRSTVELVIYNGASSSDTFLFNLTSSRD